MKKMFAFETMGTYPGCDYVYSEYDDFESCFDAWCKEMKMLYETEFDDEVDKSVFSHCVSKIERISVKEDDDDSR